MYIPNGTIATLTFHFYINLHQEQVKNTRWSWYHGKSQYGNGLLTISLKRPDEYSDGMLLRRGELIQEHTRDKPAAFVLPSQYLLEDSSTSKYRFY